MTEQTPNLTAALVALQSSLPAIVKRERATVRSDRGQYSYSYANLATVVEALYPPMTLLGLAFTSAPTLEGGHFVLRYQLRHVSGEFVEGSYPLPAGGSPQQQGSMISYARRYSLMAVVGAVSEDDDDAQAAQAEYQPAPARPARRPASADKEPSEDPETRVKRMFALYNEVGPEDRDARLADLAAILERPVASSKDLTPEDVEAVIAALVKRKRARAKENGRA